LFISANLLEAEEEGKGLNPLFRTLHSNAGVKVIYISNNPGTTACDPSIAEAKGWVVDTTIGK